MSTADQRRRWRTQAAWLTQLGLTSEDAAPVDSIEEVAEAVLSLLREVERLELDRAEARAWAWSDHHKELMYSWVSVVNPYDGDTNSSPGGSPTPGLPTRRTGGRRMLPKAAAAMTHEQER